MGCIRLMVTDNNIEPFHYHNWRPIEHFAAQGVIKDSIWLARMGCLGLKARVDIPVAGTMIIVNDRLKVEHPPNGWPINAESGWQEYHNKAEKTFEEIVAELANSRFNKTVFEGTATAQAFEWDIAMESTWPVRQNRLREKWEEGSRTQGVTRSGIRITWSEWQTMFRSLTHSRPIGLVQSAYVACLMRGDNTKFSVAPASNIVRTTKCSSATGNAHVWLSGHPQEHLCTRGPRHSHQPTRLSKSGRLRTICR